MLELSDHMFTMSGLAVPASYLISSAAPILTTVQCRPQEWVRLAFRGVAGAHLYEVRETTKLCCDVSAAAGPGGRGADLLHRGPAGGPGLHPQQAAVRQSRNSTKHWPRRQSFS